MKRRMNLTRMVAICFAFVFLMTTLSALPISAATEQLEIVTQVGNLPGVRDAPAAMVTDDGMLLVVGGTDDCNGAGTLYSTVIRYGLENHTVSYGATMPYTRWYPNYAVGTDGNLYVFGGYDGGWYSDVQIYNSANNTWWTRTGAPNNMGGGCAVALTNGSFITFETPWTSDSTMMYTPTTDTWHTLTANPLGPVFGSERAVLLNSTAILVMGGYNGVVAAISACEIYNPVADTWTAVADMPIAVAGGGAFIGNDGFVYYVGGSSAWPNTGTETPAIQRYDPANDIWTVVSATISPDKAFFGIAQDKDGDVFVVGGWNTTALDDIDMIQTINLAGDDEITALKDLIANLNSEISDLQNAVANLETEDSSLLDEIAALQGELNQTEDALNIALDQANNNADDANTAASNANMMALIGVLVGIIGIVVGLIAMTMAKKKGGQGPQMVAQPGQIRQ